MLEVSVRILTPQRQAIRSLSRRARSDRLLSRRHDPQTGISAAPTCRRVMSESGHAAVDVCSASQLERAAPIGAVVSAGVGSFPSCDGAIGEKRRVKSAAHDVARADGATHRVIRRCAIAPLPHSRALPTHSAVSSPWPSRPARKKALAARGEHVTSESWR